MSDDQAVSVISNLGGAGAAIIVLWWRLQKTQDRLEGDLKEFAKQVRAQMSNFRERLVRLEVKAGIEGVPSPVDNDETPIAG